ncbi:DUF3037 domain-containing protein [Marinicellulosiphila megalodicopiae]|uniref:DUF3037 domain-containing protein n=1 Tax=Marinicellulosiphila megalodicopiae TaxID=2724896 RepID=UPI003BAFF716
MNNQACRYAVVRFMPYPESEEFANIGIIMAVPKLNKFLFKLEIQNFTRYTQFFKHLDKALVSDAVKYFTAELAYLNEQVENQHINAMDALEHLVMPRANIINFSEQRTKLISTDLDAELTNIFDDFVNHKFATKESYEKKLHSKINGFLTELNLERPFIRQILKTDNGFTARFDLTQVHENARIKIIKPLFLDTNKVNKIYEHSDAWLAKLKRLKLNNILPKEMIFPIEHKKVDGEILDAINCVKKDFGDFGIVMNADDQKNIQDFALM